MRRLITTLFVAMTCMAWATVYTVSNTPNVAQFTTIQLAVDASANGDTVYVYGSPNAYAGFTIVDKRITVIGPGWAPDKNLPLQALVNSEVFIRDSPASGSPNGSELQGLIFSAGVQLSRSQVTGDFPVENLRIIRCQFNSSINWTLGATGHLVEGCVFYNTLNFSSSATYTNILFQNNMFFFSTCCISTQINGLTNSINVRFDHNLFYSSNNSQGNNVLMFGNNCRFVTLTNNIFNQANAGQNLSFSTFNNNITNNISLNVANATSNATPWNVNSNVDGGGNIANQNPQLTAQSAIDAGNGSPLQNFTVVTGSAINSGADGKDMGLLYDATGSLNWTNSRNARIPRIVSFNITTPTVAPGANLSISVDARKSN